MPYSIAQGKDDTRPKPKTIYRNFPGPALVGRKESNTGDATPLTTSAFTFSLLAKANAAAWRTALGVVNGVSNFLGLSDTPSSYASQANKVVSVSSGEASLEFTTPHYVPAGGTSGQVLTKNSGTDYDTGWATPSAGGSGFSGYLVNGDSPIGWLDNGSGEPITAD